MIENQTIKDLLKATLVKAVVDNLKKLYMKSYIKQTLERSALKLVSVDVRLCFLAKAIITFLTNIAVVLL